MLLGKEHWLGGKVTWPTWKQGRLGMRLHGREVGRGGAWNMARSLNFM